VRCPHCFSFVKVPKEAAPQVKITEPPADPDGPPLIVFACTHCRTRIETDPANAGLACMCPGCHVSLTVPGNAQPIFPRDNSNGAGGRGLDRVVAYSILGLVALSAACVVALTIRLFL